MKQKEVKHTQTQILASLPKSIKHNFVQQSFCPFKPIVLFKRKHFLFVVTTGSITRHDIDAPPVSERMISIYKYEDIFMPSTAYQTFNSPFCLLLIVALTFYLLMGTP